MRPSRWDEWAVPSFRATAGSSLNEHPDTEYVYGVLADVPDPGQPEPIAAHMAAHGNRPILMPLFPIGYFTPQSGCPHRGPIRDGSTLVCMVCHDTGMRRHPILKETAKGAVKIKSWKPPDSGDQWSDRDTVETAEPTRYEGVATPRTRRQKRADASGQTNQS